MNTAVIGENWVGRVVDRRFTLLQWLGGTASGGVFLTELAGDRKQKAAIKFIPADAGDAEARIAAWPAATALSHPHLMRLLYTGRCRIDSTDLLYTVSEYAEENLAQIIPERPLTSAETREMLDPVLDALACLHSNGLVHGHLRPSNIMVVDNNVKLSTDRLYLSGQVWKHFPVPGVYDAPESATQMSPAADIWSLGVTLVQTLTQRPPLWEKSTGADPVVPDSIPQPFAGIARECLRRDPARRCTLDQIKARLDPARKGAAAPVRDTGTATRSKVPLGAIVAGVLVLLAVIAFLYVRTLKTSPSNAAAQSPSSLPAPQPPASSQSNEAAPVPGAVATRVMPVASEAALGTIQGTVRVSVRVAVNSSGDVSDASLASPGPSRYFANSALEAARRWKFKPAQRAGRVVPSAWILHFQFRQAGAEVGSIEAAN